MRPVRVGVSTLLLAGCALAAGAGSASSVRVDAQGRLVRVSVPLAPARAASSRPGVVREPAPAVKDVVETVARLHDVDPLLVQSVIAVESNFNQFAVSPKGAEGLMQLIPATARRFGATNSFNVRENVEAGVRYLKHLAGKFNQDLTLTLAAYNAGEGAVLRHGRGVPPYRETREYVVKVGERYERARKKAIPVPTVASAKPVAAEPGVPVETARPLEQYVDDQGRLYLRTR